MSIALIAPSMNSELWIQAFIQNGVPREELRLYPHEMDEVDHIKYAACWMPPHGVLASLPNLELVLTLGAGVDYLFDDPSLPRVPFTRIIDPDLTMRMSEYVVMQVLLHHRQHLRLSHFQSKKHWQPFTQWAAKDMRIGIMGLGELGCDAAIKLAALGFRVSGWSKSCKDIPQVKSYHGDDMLERFLSQTDILVSLLPLTPKTEGILNGNLFKKLAKDGPLGAGVLINAGRGKLQVEEDILKALEEGDLFGVSLDVFEIEPLDARSALWNHPRVIITPHMAAESDPYEVSKKVLQQIAQYEKGEKIEGEVFRQRGY